MNGHDNGHDFVGARTDDPQTIEANDAGKAPAVDEHSSPAMEATVAECHGNEGEQLVDPGDNKETADDGHIGQGWGYSEGETNGSTNKDGEASSSGNILGGLLRLVRRSLKGSKSGHQK